MHKNVVIAGAGPAGLACARAIVSERPDLDVLLLEAGRPYQRRPRPVDRGFKCTGCGGVCNVISGFGGSMHYGDGAKLSQPPSGRRLVDHFGTARAEELCAIAFDLAHRPARRTAASARPEPVRAGAERLRGPTACPSASTPSPCSVKASCGGSSKAGTTNSVPTSTCGIHPNSSRRVWRIRVGGVTALPSFARSGFAGFGDLVFAAHDVSTTPLVERAGQCARAGVLPEPLVVGRVRGAEPYRSRPARRCCTAENSSEGVPVTVSDLPSASCGRDRTWHPWSPIQQTQRLTLISGRGCHVRDDHGRSYLDLRAGTLNATVGYGHPTVVEAIRDQASRLMTWDLAEVSTPPARELADRIADLLPEPLEYTLFCNSGSEATEAALKIARMWHRIQGRSGRTTVMSFADGYHGATTAAIAATAAPFRRDGAGPLPGGYAHLATPRCTAHAEDEDHAECRVPGVSEWEAQLLSVGPESVAAVLIEPVLSVGGIIVPPPGELAGLRALCDRHGILLVADEVATGFGRTGRMFGFEHDLGADGSAPDIITTAKGLTGGYAPLAAVTVRSDIYEAFAGDPLLGGLRHGHTTGGHATACAAALAVLDIVENDKLVAAAATRGTQLLDALTPLKQQAAVRDVRGQGLLIGVEMASMELAAQVARAAQKHGVLIRSFGSVLTVAPPLVISELEAERGARALSDAIQAVTSGATR